MKTTLMFAALLSLATPALAHDYELADMMIYHPHILAPHAGAKAAGGFVELHNSGERADRLIAVETDVAAKVEIHTTETDADGVTRMIHMAEGIPLAADEMVTMEPGATHIMLMGLSAPLAEGDKVPAVFVFEKAGRVEVFFAVEARAAAAEPAEAHGAEAGH